MYLRVTDFRAAAEDYFARGMTTIPLVNDNEGRPKRPFSDGWQHTPYDWTTIRTLPWDQALGIGVLLGESSDNLGVIDLDDVALASAIFEALTESGSQFYAVRTIRQRGHLYFRQGVITDSRTFRHLSWRDSPDFTVELKTRALQVAAPPTPGYAFCGTSRTPTPVGTLASAWDALAHTMGVETPHSADGKASSARSSYPRAWQKLVSDGERNNAIYVESCRLAEAGMPLQSAIETMLARVQVAYAGGAANGRVEITVRSAYKRVLSKRSRGGVAI